MNTRQSRKSRSGSGTIEEQLKREFAARLRKLRDQAKETQKEVAKALGFASESVYQLWEKEEGGNLPTAFNLHKLAVHFGVSTDYLLGLQVDPQESPIAVRQTDEDKKRQARRQVFDLAWHGKDWNDSKVAALLVDLYRPEESLERCYNRVLTDVLFTAQPEELPPLRSFETPEALELKHKIERLFQARSRKVTMYVLDLGQVPSERFQRNILGMQGAQLMKERMAARRKAFTLAVSNGWLAREVLLAPNLARGEIENVTVIPLTLGRSQPDETSTTTIIGQFAYKHGDYGVELIPLKGSAAARRIAMQAVSIDLAFMGAATLEPGGPKTVFADLLAEKHLNPQKLADDGVIGNILYHLIRADPSGKTWEVYPQPKGAEIAIDIGDPDGDEKMGDETLRVLKLETLRELIEVVDAQIVMLIKDKARAILARAALEMRWANSVICPLPVARELLRLISPE